MTFPTTDEAEQAIHARTQGIWDDPALIKCGLLNHLDEDVRHIKISCLTAYGYKIGVRDTRLKRDFVGCAMVCESFETPDEDPWCIVGDDIDELIDEAYKVLVEMQDANEEHRPQARDVL